MIMMTLEKSAMRMMMMVVVIVMMMRVAFFLACGSEGAGERTDGALALAGSGGDADQVDPGWHILNDSDVSENWLVPLFCRSE